MMIRVAGLVVLAGEALVLNQKELGGKLGVSRKTIGRWMAGATSPAAFQVVEMARLVYPKDRALAVRMVTAAGTTLDEAGIEKPAPPTPPPPPAHFADLVLCEAADALDLAPRVALAGLLAAVRRARELGIGIDTLEEGLTARLQSKPPERARSDKPRARRA